ncbi:hypothetical protein [Halostella litorea]|uniref:hypothetical protein n=1 Tax=Halostella litorea TaxID=2528831 RepID=UPI0010918964|nr:hypothetical protein [Halostella litorea]
MDRATLERRAWTVALSLLVASVVGVSVAGNAAAFLLVAAIAFVVAYPIVSRILGRSIGQDGDRPGDLTLFWGTILLSTPLLWMVERAAPDGVAFTARSVAFAVVFLFATWLAYYGGYDRIRRAV